jgi:hypothetical protein
MFCNIVRLYLCSIICTHGQSGTDCLFVPSETYMQLRVYLRSLTDILGANWNNIICSYVLQHVFLNVSHSLFHSFAFSVSYFVITVVTQ